MLCGDSMKEKLQQLWEKYRSQGLYLVFGVLTTVVNYLVYLPCLNGLHMSAAVSNAAAWCAAVAFAFVTNKSMVFESRDWSLSVVLPELGKFLVTRLGSGAAETGILWLTVDVLHMNGNIWKLVTSVLVIVLNYVGSKLLVFRKDSRN